ncbi:MAG: VIT and VWA domain-containing protein [Alphaproteobacteria bacterium]|nr:VIT and VWA domain-containing protein [Alphaproteobacteria bacterium]
MLISRISRYLAFSASMLVGMSVSMQDSVAAGLLSPADGSTPPLVIQDQSVRVVVEDGYAITTVDQVFRNPHSKDFEATYSFPVPNKAAVSGFTYWIDGKPVTGEVLPKEKARRIYDAEKQAGREAGLTEQKSYKTFDISVTPVRAGRNARIRLSYIQPAHVDTGIGRYVYPLEEGGVDENKLAFWTANEEVAGRFSFDLHLRSSYPATALRLPKHPQAVISKISDREWRVHMDNGGGRSIAPQPVKFDPDEAENKPIISVPTRKTHVIVEREARPVKRPSANQANSSAYRLDTDIVVYWRLAENLPGSVDFVAHRPNAAKPGTFMMVLTPGDDLKPIVEGRDWVFVLDKSGSMKRKFRTLIEGVEQGIGRLRPSDRFRIVLFDRHASEVTSGFRAATPENVKQAIAALRAVQPGDSTNLFDGLKLGLKFVEADRTTAILLVTDGVANVGETRKKALLKLVKKADVRLFTFVMGNGANRPLLNGMTRASGGTSISISNSDDIVGAVMAATSKVTHEALHKVSIKIGGVRTGELTPERLGSLYRGEQLVVLGKYWGPGDAKVTLSGLISGQPVTYTTRFDFPATATLNPEIERLWAFSAIDAQLRDIDDFGESADRKQVVTDLGVEYGLVTPYTSMLVVRNDIFVKQGIERRNTARRVTETAAATKRASGPVRSRRVDKKKPMFRTPQPSYSGGVSRGGGGSTGLVGLVLLLIFGAAVLRSRKRAKA